MRAWVLGFVVLLALSPVTALAQTDKDCADFTYQEDAQDYFDSRGGSPSNNVDLLDENNNGIPCEANPPRPAGATAAPTRTSAPSDTLPNNGLSTTAYALLGLTLVEFGAGLVLLSQRH